ncbi:MAG: haloacid dehalogenase-like hydrolase [Bacteroidetes bacterium]|nr:haloacid dehalogenase-like hydrolase [Bacteroidota bacterium]MCK5764868.1 haloacid dehalogenase-like hydrolase [Bacteroidales bacterium]
MRNVNTWVLLFLVWGLIACTNDSHYINDQVDPLPSWAEGDTKASIINFVQDAANPESEFFIALPDRIAVFDNDGTLWSEQPSYFQLFFIIDRVKEMAPGHPKWKDEQPFKAVLENDMTALAKSGEEGLITLLLETHSGMTADEFNTMVLEWVQTTKHPTKNRPFTDLVYQPMLELLNYLRENNFKTYVVSGGGVDFMRPVLPEIYGIPVEQIIGSTIKTKFDDNNGMPVMRRLSELDFINDKEGKPINIHKIIGKKPVFCGGNSDGDLAMMQWTASNKYKSFMLYVHHTDSIREWAYDRNSHIGRFDKGLDEAIEKGWTVVDMENDWEVIFPYEAKLKH